MVQNCAPLQVALEAQEDFYRLMARGKLGQTGFRQWLRTSAYSIQQVWGMVLDPAVCICLRPAGCKLRHLHDVRATTPPCAWQCGNHLAFA